MSSAEYRSATVTCMFMMSWCRPEIYNATQEQFRHMTDLHESHGTALKRLMKYIVGTEDRGMVFKPNQSWDDSVGHKFVIHRSSDSDYAANIDDRCSISSGMVCL